MVTSGRITWKPATTSTWFVIWLAWPPARAVLQGVGQKPGRQVVIPVLSRGLLQNDVHQFLLGIAQLHAVDSQKYQHHMGAGSLVAVYKRVIFTRPIQGGRLSAAGKGRRWFPQNSEKAR